MKDESLSNRLLNFRAANGNALLKSFQSAQTHSELSLFVAWQEGISKIPSLLTSGWYSPPLGGGTILIGNSPLFERINYQSIRVEEKWPRSDIFLSDDSLIYAFSSPVLAENALIGDFGLPLCRTNSESLRSTLREVFSLTVATALLAEEGMEFCELFQEANKLYGSAGFTNSIYSKTDPLSSNIGHTLPWTYYSQSTSDITILNSGKQTEINELISLERVFINQQSKLKISAPMAITIEPKLGKSKISVGDFPPMGFHLTMVFEEGRRHIISGFKPLLDYFGMSGWLDEKDLGLLDA